MVICASCGQESPEDFAFCPHCGAALAEPALRREERKTVSVLFCDLVGFTARSESADPEDVRATLAPYHQAVKTEIERFGGVVEKFVGDAVMAIFGAPRTHEDDAERAVRSALAATHAIEALNAAHPGLDLAVRAAVNTGEAVVVLDAHPERGEAMVAGDVVNTASRLQQAAPVGAVVVGELTYRSTRGAIDYEELPAATLKGKAAPVQLWRAVRAYAAHYGAAVRPATRLVGRTEELETLSRAWERARSHRVPQLVTVVGEPGVGKTRLLSEFRSRVGEDAMWLQGRSLPYGDGITFWALAEIVKQACGILESDPPDQARAKLRASVDAAIPQGPDRPWITGRLEPLIGLTGEEREPARREDAFAAWTAYLRALAHDRPMVVALEDLHWADAAMVGFAAHLVEWAEAVPILVLATARPELYDQTPTWGGGKHDAVTIALGPLEDPETAQLVQALLQGPELPGEIRSEVLERIGGNPLYAEEFCASLREREILIRHDGRWSLAPGKTVPIPETLQALVAARIDTLEPVTKAVLEDAAVVGKVFSPSAVAAIGGRDESEVRAQLHILATNEFVRPVDRLSGIDEFSFWHVALRDVAYAELPRAERIRKHTAAAAWIERTACERVGEYAEILAHHATEALELALAAGDERAVAGLTEPAGRYLALAGDRAYNLDPERALGMLKHALELLPADHPDRGRALIRAMLAAARTGKAEAVSLGEEAEAWFEARGDVAGQVEALTWLGPVATESGDTARCRELRVRAGELAETLPPGSVQADAFAEVAHGLVLDGREPEALVWAERAVAVANGSGQLRSRASPLGDRGACLLGLGRGAAALADVRRALQLAHELGDTRLITMEYCNLGDALHEIDGPAAALAAHEEGNAFDLRRVGVTKRSQWLRAETTSMLFELGRWDEILEVATIVDAYAEGHGQSYLGLFAPPRVIAVHTYRGDLERASVFLEDLLPRARGIMDPQIVVPALTAAILVGSAGGNTESVRMMAEEVEAVIRTRPVYRGWCAPDAVRALVAQGDLEQARAFLYEPITLTRPENGAVTVRALLADADGDLERALELYADVASRWERFGNVVEQAHALLREGRCLVRLDRMREAGCFLDQAEAIFKRLGAGRLAKECRAAGYVAAPPT